jgi:hypothetical protein
MTITIYEAINSSSSCDATRIPGISECMTSHVHSELYIIGSMTPYVHFEPYIIEPYQLSEISRKLPNGFLEIVTMIAISHTCICMCGIYVHMQSHMHERGGVRICLRFGIKGGEIPQKPQRKISILIVIQKGCSTP